MDPSNNQKQANQAPATWLFAVRMDAHVSNVHPDITRLSSDCYATNANWLEQDFEFPSKTKEVVRIVRNVVGQNVHHSVPLLMLFRKSFALLRNIPSFCDRLR